MAKILTNQADLDAVFKRMETDVKRFNRRQQANAIREIGRVRGEVADMLADFADDDGTIKRQRMSRLLRDLDGIEESLREHGKIAFDREIDESSECKTRRVNRAVGLELSARQFDRMNKHVANYVLDRLGEEGLV